LLPVSGIKALVINENGTQAASLFINGECFFLDNDSLEFAHLLAKGNTLTTEKAKSFTFCLKNHQLLTNVLNKGFWYIE
jgi:50S ribosomal protein L16 3-hydroxylase